MRFAVLDMVHPPDSARAVPAPDDPREQLVREHLRGVWRFLRLLGCAPDEADDLTQETFVVAFRKGVGDRTRPQTSAFLRGTARHLFLRSREQRDRRVAILAASAERLWERTCGDDEGDRRIALLRECVAELGGRARNLVRLFYGEGRSRTEVAVALGMQETGVKTALQRARKSLKDCLRRKMS